MTLDHFEIERKYLLRGLPDLPPGTRALRIRQGYLHPEAGGPGRGRLRQSLDPDGVVTLTHTIKEGEGLVRREIQRELDQAEFEMLWPRTRGLRLRKTRFETPGPLIWQIDRFDDRPLILAELELEHEDQAVEIPPWLCSALVREVTTDPNYTNSMLARSTSQVARECESAKPPVVCGRSAEADIHF